ncbi:MAG: hypothetical protein Q9160_004640 [Pyrenula sp. 1 TL-2023]
MPPETSTTTRCRHEFHQDCFEQVREDCHALGKPTPCPMCRQLVTLEPLCLICRSPLWDTEKDVSELGRCKHKFHKLCIHTTELDQYRRNIDVPLCGRIYCFHCRQPIYGPPHWCEEINIEGPNGYYVTASLSRDMDIAHILIKGPDGWRGFAHLHVCSLGALRPGAGERSLRAQMTALLDTISRTPLFSLKWYTAQSLAESRPTRFARKFLLPGSSTYRIFEFLRNNVDKDIFDELKQEDALAAAMEVLADPEARKAMPQHTVNLLEEGMLPGMRTGSFLAPIDDDAEFKKMAREVLKGLKNVDPFELGWYPENG